MYEKEKIENKKMKNGGVKLGRGKPCKVVKTLTGLGGRTVREFDTKKAAKEWIKRQGSPGRGCYVVRER